MCRMIAMTVKGCEMNIIKVIVDEMPESCCRCPLMGKDDDWGSCLSGQELDSDYNVRRPDWCPLMAGEFIETQFDKRYHIIRESEVK